MKANIKGEDKFKPITLEITLESPEEVSVFRHVFNHTAIVDSVESFSSIDCEEIRDLLTENGSVSFTAFSKKLRTEIGS